MKKILRSLRTSSNDSGNEKNSQRRLIIVCLVIGLVLVLIEIYIVTALFEKVMLSVFSGLVLLSLFFAYRNRLLFGRVVVPVAGFAIITLFVYSNGIHDEAIGGYYLVMLFAGLLLGNAGLIFFGILNTLAIVSIGLAEYNGWISNRFVNLTDVSTIITSAMFMLGTMLVFRYMVLIVNREAKNARDSEKAQLIANEALRRTEAQLESRVIERTAELNLANNKMLEQLEKINQLQEKLQEEAIRDPLTGLFNRRYLKETVAREIARAHRENHAIGFIFLDIDHFKEFNDLYGHATGDIVLKTVADLLNSQVRVADIPCRMGGEEFLLVLPDMIEGLAQQRAECFRKQLESMPIPYGDKNLTLTVSIGVASYPKNGENWDDLYHAVDGALYRAKVNGRNRVEHA